MIKTLIFAPFTWFAVFLIVVMEWGYMKWFHPPFWMGAAALGVGLIALLLWPVVFFRSGDFQRRYRRRQDMDRIEEIRNLLTGCLPDFQKPALECLALAEKIRQEFSESSFQDEVDTLLTNLAELTHNHVELLDRSGKFGTDQQKASMKGLLDHQTASVRSALTALKRFSGNLTLFDTHLKDRQEIDGELKAINSGLQDAIQEVHHE